MTAYTDSMVARLRAAQPISFDTAADLASDLGVSTRSVISKAKSLGLDYVPKAKVKVARTRKADLAAALRQKLGADPDSLPSLDKLTAADLISLYDFV